MSLLGAIEAGGTKFNCAVGTGPDDVRSHIRIPTTTPAETLGRVVDFFADQQKAVGAIEAIGIGAFGPVGVSPAAEKFGWFLDTPKPGWQQIEFAGVLQRALDVRIGFDTDVNAAALGEHRWGNAQGTDGFYLFDGGDWNWRWCDGGWPAGAWIVASGDGHIFIPQDTSADDFAGVCPFHQNCLEGLASGLAMEKRWGRKGVDLPIEHPAWALEAKYLALGLVNYVLMFSPQRIIMGGGVMAQQQLFPMVRAQVRERLNGYLNVLAIVRDVDNYIVPPRLGDSAGLAGAFALVMNEH